MAELKRLSDVDQAVLEDLIGASVKRLTQNV